MKVNPLGIQSYQQITQRNNSVVSKTAKENTTEKTGKQVSISPQGETTGSKLAVKLQAGNYSEFLTPEEKSALDILFSRFQDSQRFGPGYQKDSQEKVTNKTLGNMIDVKG